MKAAVTLEKFTAEYNFDPDQRKGWALMVRATNAVNMDPEIFVYHRMLNTDAYTGDLFEAVASVNQYYEIPKNAPKIINEDELIPYYKRNQLEVFARTPSELEEIWEYIKIDVSRLVADINSTDILTAFQGANIADDGGLETYEISENRVSLALNFMPAGNWDGETITDPSHDKQGWLPVTEFENGIAEPIDAIPEHALFYYNIDADKDFKLFFKKYINKPYNNNILELNGMMLLYGSAGAYSVTKDTVFWLENKNWTIEGTQQNPWPDDYIDGLPLSYLPQLRLIMPDSQKT